MAHVSADVAGTDGEGYWYGVRRAPEAEYRLAASFDRERFGAAATPSPLALRATPVSVGDEVYLVGVPYVERGRAQNVYRGRVTARGFGDRFRYDIEPPVDIRGFSGAPILDSRGLVVGVMTVWFDPKMQGEKFLEAGGEDAAAIITQMPR